MTTYKIIGFDKTTGVISIQFDEKMAPLSIDIPLNEQGLYITGDELDQYIKGFIPTWHLERVSKIAAGIPNAPEIEALVTPLLAGESELPKTLDIIEMTEADENLKMWAELEQEKQVARVLVKFGLLKEDPTKIQVTAL